VNIYCTWGLESIKKSYYVYYENSFLVRRIIELTSNNTTYFILLNTDLLDLRAGIIKCPLKHLTQLKTYFTYYNEKYT